MKNIDLLFQHPFTCIVAGPTKAGKTSLIKQLVKNSQMLITPPPTKIWWCYSEQQPAYDELKNFVFFSQGLPDLSLLKEHFPEPQLLILDDLMTELENDKNLVKLFTRACHHWSISVVHIVQNLFNKGLRTSRINAEYLILLKNPSDQLLPQVLAKQLFPNKTKYFIEAYTDATLKPHTYLLIDLNQNTPDKLRLRTSIFPDKAIFYTPKV